MDPPGNGPLAPRFHLMSYSAPFYRLIIDDHNFMSYRKIPIAHAGGAGRRFETRSDSMVRLASALQ